MCFLGDNCYGKTVGFLTKKGLLVICKNYMTYLSLSNHYNENQQIQIWVQTSQDTTVKINYTVNLIND